MKHLLVEHGAHLAFVLIGVIAFVWTAYRPERDKDAPLRGDVADAESAEAGRARTTVRRSVARRGLLALGPLLGAVATGAVLYGIDVGGGAVPGAVIWVHAGVSMLALLLVVYKVADMGLARVRRAFSRQHLPELVSIVLGVLSVPILVTGIALLFAPSTGSFSAYLHLISSAWWTSLMVWHLRRHLGASLRAVAGRDAARVVSPGRGVN
ncbi:MAG TPA: hypothetical protein VHX88_02460 [Solirubrobacteraceae bacterium]|jgi:hypothetical protein|nr:hypothetical protein [Solirubrobacteraceae bacterium]